MKITLSILTFGLCVMAFHLVGWMLNQPSDLAFVGGFALIPTIVFSTLWAFRKIYQ